MQIEPYINFTNIGRRNIGWEPSYRSGLFKMISAAITPGIQPQMVRINTINTEPQPLSITARGGNNIESSTLQKLIDIKLKIYSKYRSAVFTFVTLPFLVY